MESRKENMCDFVYGDCDLVKESGKFVAVWLKTNGKPCSKCRADKTKCGFYKELTDRDDLDEEKNSP